MIEARKRRERKGIKRFEYIRIHLVVYSCTFIRNVKLLSKLQRIVGFLSGVLQKGAGAKEGSTLRHVFGSWSLQHGQMCGSLLTLSCFYFPRGQLVLE